MPPKTHPSSGLMRSDFLLTLRLALPLIFAEVGWMSMGVVDTIMVGRLPNSAVAIGATGLGQSLYHAVAIFGGGLLLGMDTFVAQAHGRDDIQDEALAGEWILSCFGPHSDSYASRIVLADADAAIWSQ